MKHLIFLLAVILSFAAIAPAQSGKTNDAISRQIKALGVEKAIIVSFDSGGNASKIMAVTENFSNSEVDRAGIQAMNFAMGFFYPGNTLAASPERLHLTFWVLTKKPRFAENHHFTANLGGGKMIDLGEARYSPKPREDMEYLNFEISNTDLAAIAAAGNVTFHLGPYIFTTTSEQQKVMRSLVRIGDVSITN
jgi:hypothetical protein